MQQIPKWITLVYSYALNGADLRKVYIDDKSIPGSTSAMCHMYVQNSNYPTVQEYIDELQSSDES